MYIKVKVLTGAKKEKLEKKSENSFLISVKEPAERNLANKKIGALVAQEFKIPLKSIKIVSGHHSPSKILALKI